MPYDRHGRRSDSLRNENDFFAPSREERPGAAGRGPSSIQGLSAYLDGSKSVSLAKWSSEDTKAIVCYAQVANPWLPDNVAPTPGAEALDTVLFSLQWSGQNSPGMRIDFTLQAGEVARLPIVARSAELTAKLVSSINLLTKGAKLPPFNLFAPDGVSNSTFNNPPPNQPPFYDAGGLNAPLASGFIAPGEGFASSATPVTRRITNVQAPVGYSNWPVPIGANKVRIIGDSSLSVKYHTIQSVVTGGGGEALDGSFVEIVTPPPNGGALSEPRLFISNGEMGAVDIEIVYAISY